MSLATSSKYLAHKQITLNQFQTHRNLKDDMTSKEHQPYPPILQARIDTELIPLFKYCENCGCLHPQQIPQIRAKLQEFDEERIRSNYAS